MQAAMTANRCQCSYFYFNGSKA